MKLTLPFENLARLIRRPDTPGRASVAGVAHDYIAFCRGTSKRSTCATYSTALTRHILPEFGARNIETVCIDDINRFLRKKAFPDFDQSLSPGTLRLLVCVMRGLFRYAAERGYAVVGYDSIRCPAQNGTEARVLDAQEQLLLRNYLCRDPQGTELGVLICLYTGLRIGEICALRWGDIDLEHGCLRVCRTMQRIRNLDWDENCGQGRTKVIIDAPKSRSGKRSIPLPGFLLELLYTRRKEPDCYVLTGKAGKFIEPRTFQRRYLRILQQAGVEYVNFHALRHTFATNCVQLGFDAKALSEILGHSSVSVTLNTYVHPSAELLRSYMELLQ